MSQDTSGLYKGISALGSALAFGLTILATPLIFDLTKIPLYRYFLAQWGTDWAWLLVWVMGGWGGMIAITLEGWVRMDFNSTGMHRGYVLEDGGVQVNRP